MMLRPLWTWQRWMAAATPKVLRITKPFCDYYDEAIQVAGAHADRRSWADRALAFVKSWTQKKRPTP